MFEMTSLTEDTRPECPGPGCSSTENREEMNWSAVARLRGSPTPGTDTPCKISKMRNKFLKWK